MSGQCFDGLMLRANVIATGLFHYIMEWNVIVIGRYKYVFQGHWICIEFIFCLFIFYTIIINLFINVHFDCVLKEHDMFDLMMMAKLIHIYFSGSLNMHRICSNSCIYYEIVLHVNYVKKLVLSIAIDEFLLLQVLLLSVHILLYRIYFIVGVF